MPDYLDPMDSVMPDYLDPRDRSPPGSSVSGILQARILEWAALPFSRGSSHPQELNPHRVLFFTTEPPVKKPLLCVELFIIFSWQAGKGAFGHIQKCIMGDLIVSVNRRSGTSRWECGIHQKGLSKPLVKGCCLYNIFTSHVRGSVERQTVRAVYLWLGEPYIRYYDKNTLHRIGLEGWIMCTPRQIVPRKEDVVAFFNPT